VSIQAPNTPAWLDAALVFIAFLFIALGTVVVLFLLGVRL
jgi:hypothetical protein